ncbi:MAG: hypothetical protein O3A46_11515, partial [Candidatus Poribacteria bacterium]|nr:hypothetical protein [Candidatus Poribacteria bacterium]
LNRELSGMGGDDESQSLNELRDRLGRLHAQASMTTEMRGKSLDERMRQYKLKAKSESARSRFLERVQDRPLAGGATADQKSLQSGGDAS